MINPDQARLTDGTFYRHWRCSQPPRAVILLVHGMGEHSGRYQELADYCCAHQLAVVAPDHLGHGESPGTRAHVARFEQYLQPLLQLRDAIDNWYPDTPCFLVGHSMGGLIAAQLLLQHQQRFAGAALSGAALQVEPAPPRLQRWVISLISVLWPTLGVMQLDASQVSRNPQVVAAYQQDPLVHDGKISARLVHELFASMEAVAAGREAITLPLLVLHGAEDSMTAPAGSEAFCAGAGSTDKQLIIYPQLYHEIFNEPEREQVFADLENWIMAHL